MNVLYTGLALDRSPHLRRDTDALGRLLRHAGLRLVPSWHGLALLTAEPKAVFARSHDAGRLLALGGEPVFLGLDGEGPVFALDLSAAFPGENGPDLGLGGDWRPLRWTGTIVSFAEAALLAYARGLLQWHQRSRFCGACGAPAMLTEGGHARRCSGADCTTVTYPRVDPAVIMLVEDGDRVLLHRQHGWPEGMWSILAGFVEPGESLEEAVAREVHEETGIRVADIRYCGCQPWPFPSSLMIGFTGRAAGGTLTPDPHELEDARWFSRADLAGIAQGQDAAGAGELFIPPPGTIAGHMLAAWRDG